MSQFENHIRQTRIRSLFDTFDDETFDGRKSFDVEGWGIAVFQWTIAFVILVVLLCAIQKTRNRSLGMDISHHPNENANTNGTDRKSPYEEAENRRNNICKLFQSEHIQQKITRDQIRSKSCRTVDTVSTEKDEAADDHSVDNDSDLAYDEEEGNGTIVISPFSRGPGNPTSTASNDDKAEKSVSNLCAICLEEYHEGETIVWSSNKKCRHAFHRDCLVSYLVMVEKVDTYPCPCCRQNFFFDIEDTSGNKSEEV